MTNEYKEITLKNHYGADRRFVGKLLADERVTYDSFRSYYAIELYLTNDERYVVKIDEISHLRRCQHKIATLKTKKLLANFLIEHAKTIGDRHGLDADEDFICLCREVLSLANIEYPVENL